MRVYADGFHHLLGRLDDMNVVAFRAAEIVWKGLGDYEEPSVA